MNHASDLSGVGPGFVDPVFGSQAVFRAALDALSRPGRVFEVEAPQSLPDGLHPAAAALALALLDTDTAVWMAPALDNGRTRSWLRFHTGCPFVAEPGAADFAFMDSLAAAGDFSGFSAGSDERPEASTTLIVQVETLAAGMSDALGGRLSLRGPGIQHAAQLAIAGVDAVFIERWQARRAMFPRGCDLLVACGNRVAGLPRTTDLAFATEAN